VKFIDNATCITYSIFYIILGTPLNCLHVNFIHYYYLPIIHGWSLSLIWSWIIFKHIQLTFLKCCALPIRKVENLSCSMNQNRIGGVMVILLTSSVVDRGFEFWLGQTKNYDIIMIMLTCLSVDCCISELALSKSN
jgi:hypothetical protein